MIPLLPSDVRLALAVLISRLNMRIDRSQGMCFCACLGIPTTVFEKTAVMQTKQTKQTKQTNAHCRAPASKSTGATIKLVGRIAGKIPFGVLVRNNDQGCVHTIGKVTNVGNPWDAAIVAFKNEPEGARLLAGVNYEIIVFRGKKMWVIEMSIDQLRAEMSAIDARAAIESALPKSICSSQP